MTAKKPALKRDLQLASDWQEIAITAAGQRIIGDLMTWCDVYTQIDTTDPIELAKAVGANNVAKRVAYLLGLKPQQFPQQAWEDTTLLDKMMSSHH